MSDEITMYQPLVYTKIIVKINNIAGYIIINITSSWCVLKTVLLGKIRKILVGYCTWGLVEWSNE